MASHPRYYLFDTGVTNAVNRRLAAPVDPVMRERLFEQMIILETYRMLNYRRSESSMYYWRTSNGAEVDVVIEKHGECIAAFEIKPTSRVAGADCSGLRSFAQDYPEASFNIVCPARNTFTIGNVQVLPWQEYLSMLDRWL